MTEHKERTERAFDAKTMPLDVVIECLSLREHRVSTDLVRDEVEGELHKVEGTEVYSKITMFGPTIQIKYTDPLTSCTRNILASSKYIVLDMMMVYHEKHCTVRP